MQIDSVNNTPDHQEQFNMVFVNCSKEDAIYPLTVKEIAQTQIDDKSLEKLKKHDKYTNQLIEDTLFFCKDGRMVIPKNLQHQAVSCYHHYLQHPRHTPLEEMLCAAIYRKGMQNTIRLHVKYCQDMSKRMENSQQSL